MNPLTFKSQSRFSITKLMEMHSTQRRINLWKLLPVHGNKKKNDTLKYTTSSYQKNDTKKYINEIN
jgi:hypothetical protein